MLKFHNKSEDADQEMIDVHWPDLQTLLAYYSKRHIFKADNCGLRWKRVLDTTTATSTLHEREKREERYTVQFRCNDDGS